MSTTLETTPWPVFWQNFGQAVIGVFGAIGVIFTIGVVTWWLLGKAGLR